MVGPTRARLRARAMLRLPARAPSDGAPPVREAARRFRAQVAYDGGGFAGWQRQPDAVSVQEILEAALEEATALPVSVAASGRTDAGVHAEGQVVAFDSRTGLPPDAVRHLCDHLLPEAVRVRRVAEAPADFDPQRECVRKTYRYLLRVAAEPSPVWRGVSWQLPGPLDPAAMAAAARTLLGDHDFRAYRNDPGPERRAEDTRRRLDRLDVVEQGDLVRIEAEAPGFLYRMVRNLAAALVEVGAGRRPPSWPAEALARRDRTLLPPPAPPQGLCLVRVEYDPAWPGEP